ncbi:FliM/FliN family flagellar motor switch protein [Citromicrobium bathyomarinum]|uniref:FliM/FliN family flagellar motor C-terminal domain-containing protein n=1 Tax=Citromicrobium bathyomarinum TaxID=72174 RepID=UPI00315B1DD5
MIEGAIPTGERRAAQHCAELLSNTLDAVDIAGDFARFGTRLARALQPSLARLFDCHKLETELVECTSSPAAKLDEALGTQMHHARFALPGNGLGVMASAQVASLIGEFDRMLGGDGDAPEDAEILPASANRFSRQIEGELLNACIEASGRGDLSQVERGSDLGEIVPAAVRAVNSPAVHTATIAVIRPNVPQLILKFSVCEATFVQFAGETPVGKPVRRSIGEGGIENSAVSQVELSTTATLVDMAIPLHRIVALQPGTMLPVTIHRSVPLSIGETIIAHGAVGMLEERVALEIHHTAFARNIPS